MPITYQRLGNSGGGMVDLKITTYPNTEVKLQGDKVARTLISDNQGVAIFKRLKGGTYTVTANGKTKEITLIDEKKEFLCQQIKELPLKSKIKFSSGLKMVLMTKNPLVPVGEEHASNVACLMSEFVTETHKVQDADDSFERDQEWQNKMFDYYKKLTWQEKATIKPYFAKCDNIYAINTYFYMPCRYEVGLKMDSDFNKYNWGFANDSDRIKKLERSSAREYWLRDSGAWDSSFSYVAVSAKGQLVDVMELRDFPKNSGIVPCCDISQDAYVALDSDGYYRILGM